MNMTTKVIIGAAVGGVVGYFTAAVALEYRRLQNEDPNGYESSDEMPQEDDLEELERDNPINQRPTEMSKHQKTTRMRKVDYGAMFSPEMKVDLEVLASKYNKGVIQEEPEEEEEIEVDDSPEIIDVGTDKPIMVITVADFANSQFEYDQITLHYYEDDVLTDEEDNPINNAENFVGDEALLSFGTSSGDENVVYVRNHTKKAEYEILRMNTSYLPTPKPIRTRRPMKEKNEGEED